MSRSPRSVDRYDPHVFQGDREGDKDWRGELVDCSFCPFPRGNAVHVTSEDLVADLPPTPVEAHEIDDRILGEA